MSYEPDTKIFAGEAKTGELAEFPNVERGWGVTLEQTGGKPPMEWMNGAFNRVDLKHQFQSLTGSRHPFNQAFCNAIGGYPKGSIVLSLDGETLWQNTVDANTSDPDAGGAGWARVIDIATPEDIEAGTAGKLVDAAGLKGANLGAIAGEIRLLPFRPTELPPGWMHANGDRYALDSATGQALQALPTGYKEDWGITEADGMINLPSMYHTDGRGYFQRAGTTPGVVQEDAIRNLWGRIRHSTAASVDLSATGAFFTTGVGSHTHTGLASNNRPVSAWDFSADRIVPTAEENRPLNIAFVPAIYLGA